MTQNRYRIRTVSLVIECSPDDSFVYQSGALRKASWFGFKRIRWVSIWLTHVTFSHLEVLAGRGSFLSDEISQLAAGGCIFTVQTRDHSKYETSHFPFGKRAKISILAETKGACLNMYMDMFHWEVGGKLQTLFFRRIFVSCVSNGSATHAGSKVPSVIASRGRNPLNSLHISIYFILFVFCTTANKYECIPCISSHLLIKFSRHLPSPVDICASLRC